MNAVDTQHSEPDSPPSISRTVNEYATSYKLHFDNSPFDSQDGAGYLKYDLVADSAGPSLQVSTDPPTESYGANVLLSTSSHQIAIPRGIIESFAPNSVHEWTTDTDTLTAALELPSVSSYAASPLVSAEQSITTHDGAARLSLPLHQAIPSQPACTVELLEGDNGFELAVGLTENQPGTTPIADPRTAPSIELPASFALALAVENIPVHLFETGVDGSRAAVIDQYDSALATTTPDENTGSPGNIQLPDTVAQAAAHAGIDSGSLRLVLDEDTVLAVFDGHALSVNTDFTLQDGCIQFDDELARLTRLDSMQLHWHEYDGSLIAEMLPEDDSVVPTHTTEAVGDIESNGLTLPFDSLAEGELPMDTDSVGVSITCLEGSLGIQLSENAGLSCETQHGDVHQVALPRGVNELLNIETPTGLLCSAWETGVFCRPMATKRARQQAGLVDPEDMADEQLTIPGDGKHSFVHQVSESSFATTMPGAAIETFGLSENGTFRVTLGMYNGYLALQCTPSGVTEEDESCTARMVSDSELGLPMTLVSTLSLFDRSITWGILREGDGPRLLGLLESIGEQPVSLSEGHGMGSGEIVSSDTPGDSSAGFSVTISKKAFDVYDTQPPGVFVGCETIAGRPRLTVTPVGEQDLGLSGVVRVREHYNGDAVQVTVPRALALALGLAGSKSVAWTLLGSRFVGTVDVVNRF
jgi:hypothetical protein